MNLAVEFSANMWNLDDEWQKKLLPFRMAPKSHLPRLLGVSSPLYELTDSPESALPVGDVQQIQVEILSRFSQMVSIFLVSAENASQDDEICLLCDCYRHTTCFARQTRQTRETLAKEKQFSCSPIIS